MNSFIFFYSLVEGVSNNVDKLNIDVHFNFWSKYKDTNMADKAIIDIGLKIHDFKNIEKIGVLVPIKYEGIYIDDLFSITTEKRHLDIIFNDYVMRHDKREDIAFVEFEHRKALNFIKIKNDCQINSISFKSEEYNMNINATEIIINVKNAVKRIVENEININSNIPLYLKFRIKQKLDERIVKKQNKSNLFNLLFLGGYKVSQIFDFKVNVIRNIDKSYISDYLHRNRLNLFGLRSVLFFAIEPNYFDVISMDSLNSSPYQARILEQNIWGEYLKREYKYQKNMIVYKWTQKSNIPHNYNSIVFKRYFFKQNYFTILLFVIISIIIGVIASYFVYSIT